MAVIPTSLKFITSALRRAEELERDPSNESKAVSYYCRFYCVQKGSTLCSSPPTAEENKFLFSQMDMLEKLKPSLELNKDKGYDLCRNFADTVFNKADDVDRMGAADKATAKMFYSAGTFYDVLEQFGELDFETLEKKKYAKWKATEILNAIRAGLTPTPGGYSKQSAAEIIVENSSNRNSNSHDNGLLSSSLPYEIPLAPS